jgi:hypothetical protein
MIGGASSTRSADCFYLLLSCCYDYSPLYCYSHDSLTTIMQYMPFASDVELPFYMALASIKINHDKLDASARKLLGRYEIRPADPPNASCRVQIHGNALTSDE